MSSSIDIVDFKCRSYLSINFKEIIAVLKTDTGRAASALFLAKHHLLNDRQFINLRCEGVCRAWRQEVHNLVATGKLRRYFRLFSRQLDR